MPETCWRRWCRILILLLLPGLPLVSLGGSVQLLVQDADGAPLEGAVVFLQPYGVSGSADSRAEQPQEHHVIQESREFVPDTLLIGTGDLVAFPNHDSVRHHVFSFSEPRVFEFELYGGDVSPQMDFPRPGVVVLGCNIHDEMAGYIVVAPPGPAAMTGADGRLELELEEPRQMLLWHPWLLERAQEPLEIEISPQSGNEPLAFTLDVRAPPERELSELERRFRRQQ